MATKEKSKAKTNPVSAEMISKAYREHILTNGKAPASVYAFCKELGIKEAEFYQYFGSFEALEKSFWKSFFETTQERLESDADFHQFTSREKILTFYFALVEALKAERSFVLLQLKDWKTPLPTPTFLKDFKAGFEEWTKKVLESGKASGDVAKRPYLDERYHHLFWMHLAFILHFWQKDDSANFERTDAAIEKSVNLAFDLIGKGILDNAIDFGKFLYQNTKN